MLFLSGCSVQSYLIGRAARHLTGTATRFHSITPIEGSFADYRIIEVKPLDNLLLDQLPPAMEQYLNTEVVKQLRELKAKPSITVFDDEGIAQQPTLIFEGFIDDYDPGYVGLRLVELGFNHVAVTVRFQLRDKQSGRILGAASITSEDDRVTASTKTSIKRIAGRIRTFVNSGYGRTK